MSEEQGAQGGEGGQDNSGASEEGAGGVWTDGLAEDTRGYVENKGWGDPSAIVSSYQNLEKMVGAPPESLIKLPKEMTPEASREIYGRLGMPEEAAGYELAIPDGEESFGETLREIYHKAGATKDQASSMTEALMAFGAEQEKQEVEARQSKNADEKRNLEKEWGNAYADNLKTAATAAREFGMNKEQLDALEQTLGYKGTHELFHKIGSKIGEANFQDGDGNGFGNITPAAAQAALTELQGTPAFKEAFFDNTNPNHKAMVEKKSRLTRQAFPEAS